MFTTKYLFCIDFVNFLNYNQSLHTKVDCFFLINVNK